MIPRIAPLLIASSLLSAVGCTVPTSDEPEPDVAVVVERDVKAHYLPELLGYALGSGSAPLVLDPSWDSRTAELIREAARWWEDAVGVDLGAMPVADTDCTLESETPGCIVRLDRAVSGTRVAGIHLYVGTMHDEGLGWRALMHVTAHEVGHWIGIHHHTESGVMAASFDPSVQRTGLTDADVAAYEAACVE